ncbi:hypothetical protein SLS60_006610 [Paraconiothyrium brasiliense]|uniref:Uncharacterized protein n=1 Tax=Paraconiothyrium brasiliense TaxID=300254 RepID=A0ABR3RB58_9PLEO
MDSVMKSFMETGIFNMAFVATIDAKVAVWQSLLPAVKRDPMRQDGTIDEVMFLAHLMASMLLEDRALSIARDRVRLSIGYLNAMGTYWPTSATMAKEVRFVARSALTRLPNTIASQPDSNSESEIPRDDLIWPIDPSAQIDIYAGMNIPLDFDAQMIGYASSSTSSL